MRAGRLAEVCRPPTAAEGCYGLTPQDLHGAYALPATAPTAQTIALVDAYDDPTAEADLNVFDQEFHLPACTSANGCFTKVNENGKTTPLPQQQGEWALEISLDMDAAHSICQNCHILLVEASDETSSSLYTAEETAARMGATEISNSWDGEEPLTDSAVFNHSGLVITAASGDDGYLNWQSTEPAAIGHVGYPASSPHVVAVGGTRLNLTSAGVWAGESVWNGYGATGSGCSETFGAPPWQQELPNWSVVGCGSKRAVADVSADADPYTGIAIYDSTTLVQKAGGGHAPLGWETVAGTSLASPLIAATFALAGGAGEVEYPAKTLYEGQREHPGSLHDVASGSNGRCSKPYNPETGVSGCTTPEEAADCNSRAICLAGAGYDGPSGVGTPDGLAAFKPPGTQTIEFTSRAPSSAAVGGQTYTVAAVASSGLPVSLTSGTPGVCSLAGSTVSFIATGTCTIDANQAGDATYRAALEVQQSFVVSKGSQTITFTSTPPASASVGGPTYTAVATASSGLPVSFSSATPSVCSLAGATVSFVGAGTCTVHANQSGNSNYQAAPEAQQSFAVSRRAQFVEFTSSPPATATVGGPSYAVVARASSGLPVTFSSATPSVCSVQGSTVSFDGAGTCTIDAAQAGNSEYAPAPGVQQSLLVSSPSVGKRPQSIELLSAAPAAASVGGPSYTLSARASSGLPVSFSSATPSVCTPAGSAVSFVGVGTCTIDADQTGSAEYEPAPRVQQSFPVGKGSQLISFISDIPGTAAVGGPSYALAATASSGLPVSFSSATPSICTVEGSTVSFPQAGTCTIDANQPGNSNYEPAPETRQSFAVASPLVLVPATTPGATPGATPAASAPPLLAPAFTPSPDSDFSLQGNPTVNTKTGAVTFTASVFNPGTFTWLLTFRNGTFGAFSARSGKCSASQVRLKGKCRPTQIVFARSALSVGAALAPGATVTFTVTPSSSARKALANALARGRGLPVTALLSFRSSLGGSSVSHTYPITARLVKAAKARR